MHGVKMDTDVMINLTQELMNCLDNMGKATRQLYNTASNYNQSIQDGVMGDMVALLDEIGKTIEDTKAKAHEYTKDINEGAEDLKETNVTGHNKVNRI